jgi:endonuclease YncB( thermonuclease family)
MASVYVVDGDSLRAGGEDIRLVGIDAPELRQTCRDGHGREWSCGRAAKARLAALVAQGDVACTSRGRDRYGRTLAVCSARNVPDLGETMVREGYAINFAIDYGGYPAAEREAQSARSGVWQGDFERPKDWRRRHPRT